MTSPVISAFDRPEQAWFGPAPGTRMYLIVRRGVPVARLTPVPRHASHQLGWDTGPVPDPALRPMTEEEAERFLSGR